MIIEFEINNSPSIVQLKYFVAYLEGVLRIKIDGVLFFDQPEILLLEFAVQIRSWLIIIANGELSDFNFMSIDHDEPILSISYQEKDGFKIYSIWEEVKITKYLSKMDIVVSCENFLFNFSEQLKLKFGVKLIDFDEIGGREQRT